MRNRKRMTSTFNDFVSVIRKDSKVRIKFKDILDRYNRLHDNYKTKIGYDTLIQNVILKELINIVGTTITDMDIKFKKKVSRIKHLESQIL